MITATERSMKTIFFIRYSIICLACGLSLLGGCDDGLIPESAKKGLSNKTTVQTDWNDEEERVKAHKKKAVENGMGGKISTMVPENNITPVPGKNRSVKLAGKEQLKKEKKPTVKINKTIKSKKNRTVKNSYTIQVGAFSKLENAENLVKKLKKRNFKTTIKISKNGLYTVKMEHFSSRVKVEKKAQAVSSYIKTEVIIFDNNKFKTVVAPKGIFKKKTLILTKKHTSIPTPKVVPDTIFKKAPPVIPKKDPVTSPPQKTVLARKMIPAEINKTSLVKAKRSKRVRHLAEQSLKPSAIMKYSFKIGGLYSFQNAQKQRNILKAKGYNVYTVKVKATASDEIWHSLRIGYFRSNAGAATAAEAFAKRERIPAQVIR
jgi:cell division septation protein DedD